MKRNFTTYFAILSVLVLASCAKDELESPADTAAPSAVQTIEQTDSEELHELGAPGTITSSAINDDDDDEDEGRNPDKPKTSTSP